MTEDTITSIERMNIPEDEKQKILKYNAVNMLLLTL
jgi:predicted TIM-barrel fold metal-dependent hydrolase